MLPTATEPITLDLEDFRRLGVRPNECRLTVIRQAAVRSAKSLAERQLQSPSEQVALQLARVATSAYRLLDPRQRRDLYQRAHVGRILPNALAWAGQTHFLHGSPHRKNNFETPFPLKQLEDAALIGLLDLSSDVIDDDSWELSLRADDLLSTTPLMRQITRLRRQIHHPRILMAMAMVLIAAVIGVSQWRPGPEQLTLRRHVEPNRNDASPDASVASKPSRQTVGTASPSKTENTEATDPENVQAIDPAEVAAAKSPQSDIASSTEVGKVTPPTSMMEAPADPRNKPTKPAVTTIADGEQNDAMINPDQLSFAPDPFAADPFAPDPFAADPFAPDPFAADPFAADPFAADPLGNPESEPMIAADLRDQAVEPLIDAVEDPSALFLPPDSDQERASRNQIVSLLPSLAGRLSSSQVAQQIEQMQSLKNELEVGTAEHWTASLMLIEVSWLVEDVWSVRSRLDDLSVIYKAPVLPHLASTYVRAHQYATSNQTRQHLLRNGLILAEQLLRSESLDACREVITAARLSAEILDDQDSRKYLDQFAESLDQMARLAEATDRLAIGVGGIGEPSGDAGIAGRYLCLMLRRWDIGLLWLSETTDPRIANIARHEFELADLATASELVELADRWLTAASRSSGRAADSMRLHAYDLLRLAEKELTGLQRLNVERKIEQIQSELPFFALASVRDRQPPQQTSPQSSGAAVMAPEKEVVVTQGMSGRMRIDDQDIAVQINYTMGMPINKIVLDQISEKLSQKLELITIEMAGEFDCAEAASVRVATSTTTKMQEVWIDDQRVSLDPSLGTADVSLAAGKHRIRWTLQAGGDSVATLRMNDAQSGRAMDIVHPQESGELAKRTVLTVNMIGSTP